MTAQDLAQPPLRAFLEAARSVFDGRYYNNTFLQLLEGRLLMGGAKRPTARELQVLAELERGATNKEIAQRLECSVKTVEFHLNHLFEKFGVRRRAGLVGVALKQTSAIPQQGDPAASPGEAGSITENSGHERTPGGHTSASGRHS